MSDFVPGFLTGYFVGGAVLYWILQWYGWIIP